MSRASLTLAFATIFVFVNFVLVSSDPIVYDAVTFNRFYKLTDADLAPKGLTDAPDNSPFNGDSIIGDKTSVTQWYELPMSIHNPTSLVSNTTFAIGTNTSEEIFAYLAVINEEGSFAMFCCSAIGGNYVDITIRGNPNTESRFKVYAGCYKPAWA